jgi:hypothetical protein
MAVSGHGKTWQVCCVIGRYITYTFMSFSHALGVPQASPRQEPTQLIVVRRGRHSTFRLLEREFGNDPTVRIIWDRRYRDRRGSSEGVGDERRRADRRVPAPTVWPERNYFVVNIG